MRFSARLTSLGDEFRKEFLDSNDVDDKTVQLPDWREQKVGGWDHNRTVIILL